MHVMVATDGSIDTKKAASLATALAGDGQVTVFTVVEVPREMLNDMRTAVAGKADHKAQEASVEYRTTHASDPPVWPWVGDDAVVDQYVRRTIKDRTDALAAELAAAGANYTVIGEEGENAAKSVLAAAESHGVDVLCIGTHGLGRFEGLLGSLSTKVARRAQCSVLLVR
jgi:nucleotide-binding universal stress UspA family protein